MCVQKTGCLKVILEKTIGMASVPDWSEMWHSDNIHQSANRTQNDEKKDEKKTRVVTTYSVTNGVKKEPLRVRRKLGAHIRVC